MVIQDVLVFLKKYRFVISIFSVAAALAFLVVSLKIPASFEATQTIFVKRQASGESKSFYTYDGYYSAQAAERFTDSAFGASKSREFLKLIISRIESGDDTNGKIDKEVRAVKVKRLSPQLISFSYANTDQQQASRLTQNLAKVFSDLMLFLNRGGDEGISLSFVSDQPIVTVHRLSPRLSILVGSLLGIFLSLVISSVHYFIENLPK